VRANNLGGRDTARETGFPVAISPESFALKTGSGTKLWTRLSQHKGGPTTGGGNHRGSIFADTTEEEFRVLELIDAERQKQIRGAYGGARGSQY
jgi:hypothetical protein